MLDTGTYEEVEADRGATLQAVVVILLSSAAAGVGALGIGEGTASAVAFAVAVSLLVWAAWAVVVFQVGVRLMPRPQTHTDVEELFRTMGFAAAPGLLRAVGAVPGTTTLVFSLTAVWMLAAMVVAVRQALDYDSTLRAVAVCALGWGLAVALALIIGVLFGPAVY